MKRKYLFLLLILILQLPLLLQAQEKRFYLELQPGTAFVIPSKLLIHQEGFDDIVMKAKYEVRPFEAPPYYSVRAGFELKNSLAIELEMNHLKLWLITSDPNISLFSITDGYNQFWLNAKRELKNFNVRAGVGAVITHPESVIRGLRLDETGGLFNSGYYLDGITAQLAIQKCIYLTDFLYLTGESKMNVSFARSDVVNGYADISVCAIHLLAGIGFTL